GVAVIFTVVKSLVFMGSRNWTFTWFPTTVTVAAAFNLVDGPSGSDAVTPENAAGALTENELMVELPGVRFVTFAKKSVLAPAAAEVGVTMSEKTFAGWGLAAKPGIAVRAINARATTAPSSKWRLRPDLADM